MARRPEWAEGISKSIWGKRVELGEGGGECGAGGEEVGCGCSRCWWGAWLRASRGRRKGGEYVPLKKME